jgi:TldD protein
MTDSDLPQLSTLLPRELAAELLALARCGGAEFADLYAEHAIITGFTLDERRVKTASYSVLQGVGVRAIRGEQTGYAYADGFAPAALREAARVASAVAREAPPAAAAPGGGTVAFRVTPSEPPFVLRDPATLALDEAAKVRMLQRADAAARARDPRVHEVSVSLGTSAKSFLVANSDGVWAEDRTHLSRLVVSALALEDGQRQEGFGAAGGCVEAGYYVTERTPEAVAEEAAAGAVLLLSAREPEAGSYPVVVCNGWGGVMVHECFGHSMEGDTIRRKSSIRATQMGQQVAARGVTIVDSGLVPYSRGSFRVDDEGTPAQRTELVRDGVLVGYLWDRLNGGITGNRPTGNGRRASYRDYPLCRMTNTYIEPGTVAAEALIADVRRGLYCKKLGGGSVNPADGNFSFQVTEGWQIENGKLTHPVRNATLTGNGNDAMLRIDGVGSDLAIDGTTGSCGKDGQWKPVGVGQPTVRFTGITVGGTAV